MAEIIQSLADSEKDSAYEYLCRLEEAKKLAKYTVTLKSSKPVFPLFAVQNYLYIIMGL